LIVGDLDYPEQLKPKEKSYGKLSKILGVMTIVLNNASQRETGVEYKEVYFESPKG
jgi:hypothetical protein